MDFHLMKRKQLQELCKKHGVPANKTNVEMANRLTSIFKEKENPMFRGKSCLKNLIDVPSDDSMDVARKVKKVRFSPQDETIVFVDLDNDSDRRTARAKARAMRRKTMMKPVLKEAGHATNNNVNTECGEGVTNDRLRMTRSRARKSMAGDVVVDLSSPPVQKRVRRNVKSKSMDLKDVVELDDSFDYRAAGARESTGSCDENIDGKGEGFEHGKVLRQSMRNATNAKDLVLLSGESGHVDGARRMTRSRIQLVEQEVSAIDIGRGAAVDTIYEVQVELEEATRDASRHTQNAKVRKGGALIDNKTKKQSGKSVREGGAGIEAYSETPNDKDFLPNSTLRRSRRNISLNKSNASVIVVSGTNEDVGRNKPLKHLREALPCEQTSASVEFPRRSTHNISKHDSLALSNGMDVFGNAMRRNETRKRRRDPVLQDETVVIECEFPPKDLPRRSTSHVSKQDLNSNARLLGNDGGQDMPDNIATAPILEVEETSVPMPSHTKEVDNNSNKGMRGSYRKSSSKKQKGDQLPHNRLREPILEVEETPLPILSHSKEVCNDSNNRWKESKRKSSSEELERTEDSSGGKHVHSVIGFGACHEDEDDNGSVYREQNSADSEEGYGTLPELVLQYHVSECNESGGSKINCKNAFEESQENPHLPHRTPMISTEGEANENQCSVEAAEMQETVSVCHASTDRLVTDKITDFEFNTQLVLGEEMKRIEDPSSGKYSHSRTDSGGCHGDDDGNDSVHREQYAADSKVGSGSPPELVLMYHGSECKKSGGLEKNCGNASEDSQETLNLFNKTRTLLVTNEDQCFVEAAGMQESVSACHASVPRILPEMAIETEFHISGNSSIIGSPLDAIIDPEHQGISGYSTCSSGHLVVTNSNAQEQEKNQIKVDTIEQSTMLGRSNDFSAEGEESSGYDLQIPKETICIGEMFGSNSGDGINSHERAEEVVTANGNELEETPSVVNSTPNVEVRVAFMGIKSVCDAEVGLDSDSQIVTSHEGGSPGENIDNVSDKVTKKCMHEVFSGEGITPISTERAYGIVEDISSCERKDVDHVDLDEQKLVEYESDRNVVAFEATSPGYDLSALYKSNSAGTPAYLSISGEELERTEDSVAGKRSHPRIGFEAFDGDEDDNRSVHRGQNSADCKEGNESLPELVLEYNVSECNESGGSKKSCDNAFDEDQEMPNPTDLIGVPTISLESLTNEDQCSEEASAMEETISACCASTARNVFEMGREMDFNVNGNSSIVETSLNSIIDSEHQGLSGYSDINCSSRDSVIVDNDAHEQEENEIKLDTFEPSTMLERSNTFRVEGEESSSYDTQIPNDIMRKDEMLCINSGDGMNNQERLEDDVTANGDELGEISYALRPTPSVGIGVTCLGTKVGEAEFEGPETDGQSTFNQEIVGYISAEVMKESMHELSSGEAAGIIEDRSLCEHIIFMDNEYKKEEDLLCAQSCVRVTPTSSINKNVVSSLEAEMMGKIMCGSEALSVAVGRPSPAKSQEVLDEDDNKWISNTESTSPIISTQITDNGTVGKSCVGIINAESWLYSASDFHADHKASEVLVTNHEMASEEARLEMCKLSVGDKTIPVLLLQERGYHRAQNVEENPEPLEIISNSNELPAKTLVVKDMDVGYLELSQSCGVSPLVTPIRFPENLECCAAYQKISSFKHELSPVDHTNGQDRDEIEVPPDISKSLEREAASFHETTCWALDESTDESRYKKDAIAEEITQESNEKESLECELGEVEIAKALRLSDEVISHHTFEDGTGDRREKSTRDEELVALNIPEIVPMKLYGNEEELVERNGIDNVVKEATFRNYDVAYEDKVKDEGIKVDSDIELCDDAIMERTAGICPEADFGDDDDFVKVAAQVIGSAFSSLEETICKGRKESDETTSIEMVQNTSPCITTIDLSKEEENGGISGPGSPEPDLLVSDYGDEYANMYLNGPGASCDTLLSEASDDAAGDKVKEKSNFTVVGSIFERTESKDLLIDTDNDTIQQHDELRSIDFADHKDETVQESEQSYSLASNDLMPAYSEVEGKKDNLTTLAGEFDSGDKNIDAVAVETDASVRYQSNRDDDICEKSKTVEDKMYRVKDVENADVSSDLEVGTSNVIIPASISLPNCNVPTDVHTPFKVDNEVTFENRSIGAERGNDGNIKSKFGSNDEEDARNRQAVFKKQRIDCEGAGEGTFMATSDHLFFNIPLLQSERKSLAKETEEAQGSSIEFDGSVLRDSKSLELAVAENSCVIIASKPELEIHCFATPPVSDSATHEIGGSKFQGESYVISSREINLFLEDCDGYANEINSGKDLEKMTKSTTMQTVGEDQLHEHSHHMEEKVIELDDTDLVASDDPVFENVESLKENAGVITSEEGFDCEDKMKQYVEVENSFDHEHNFVWTEDADLCGRDSTASDEPMAGSNIIDPKAQIVVCDAAEDGAKCEGIGDEIIECSEVAPKSSTGMLKQRIDSAIDSGVAFQDTQMVQPSSDFNQRRRLDAELEENIGMSAQQLNSSMMKGKNCESSLIQRTTEKMLRTHDMKENAPVIKTEQSAMVKSLVKRRALEDIQGTRQ